MISNIFKLVSVGNGQRGLFKKNESYCAIFDFSFINFRVLRPVLKAAC